MDYIFPARSTNLTGVFYTNAGARKLSNLYRRILLLSSKCPIDSGYRKNVEAIVRHRLCIVQDSEGDRYKIENQICCGSMESLVAQAQAEFNLITKMILWKPWEPLMEQPPPNQWKWPPY